MSNDPMIRELQDVDDWFSYHKPTALQSTVLDEARAKFKGLARWLVASVANSRERAIALTELRKAAMCVNQAIIFDPGLRASD